MFGNRNINGTSDEFVMRTGSNRSIKTTGAKANGASHPFWVPGFCRVLGPLQVN